MTESEIKRELKPLLVESFGVQEKDVIFGKTTDLIVKIGKNKADWYYFEVKSTDKDKRKNKKAYFGATSSGQLLEALQHPNHYYFILVSQEANNIKYGIVTPNEIESYLTGYYLRADFNIPETEIQKACCDKSLFQSRCNSLSKGHEIVSLSPKSQPNYDKIRRMTEIIEKFKTEINNESI